MNSSCFSFFFSFVISVSPSLVLSPVFRFHFRHLLIFFSLVNLPRFFWISFKVLFPVFSPVFFGLFFFFASRFLSCSLPLSLVLTLPPFLLSFSSTFSLNLSHDFFSSFLRISFVLPLSFLSYPDLYLYSVLPRNSFPGNGNSFLENRFLVNLFLC